MVLKNELLRSKPRGIDPCPDLRRSVGIKTGFTLVELLIVIAVIFILAGITIPRLETGFKNQKLDIDAKKLASSIALAQSYAVGQKNEKRYYGIVFYNGGYRIVPYDGNLAPQAPVAVPVSVNINGDIPFSGGITKSSGENVIFKFDGSTNTQYSPIILTNGSSSRTIIITQLTGHISIN